MQQHAEGKQDRVPPLFDDPNGGPLFLDFSLLTNPLF
jgi:hypothetical protein